MGVATITDAVCLMTGRARLFGFLNIDKKNTFIDFLFILFVLQGPSGWNRIMVAPCPGNIFLLIYCTIFRY